MDAPPTWKILWSLLSMGVLSCFSHVRLCATLWAVAHQGPLSMEFSRQDYWSGLPCPPPGEFPDPGMEPAFLMSPALADRSFTSSATWEAHQESHLLILYAEYEWFTYFISSNSTTNPLQYLLFQRRKPRDFPGSPVFRTPCFHRKGHRFDPWLGN